MGRTVSECLARGRNDRKPQSGLLLVAEIRRVKFFKSRGETGTLIEQVANGDPAFSRVTSPFGQGQAHRFVKLQDLSAYRPECPERAEALGDAVDVFSLIARTASAIAFQTETAILPYQKRAFAVPRRILCSALSSGKSLGRQGSEKHEQ